MLRYKSRTSGNVTPLLLQALILKTGVPFSLAVTAVVINEKKKKCVLFYKIFLKLDCNLLILFELKNFAQSNVMLLKKNICRGDDYSLINDGELLKDIMQKVLDDK